MDPFEDAPEAGAKSAEQHDYGISDPEAVELLAEEGAADDDGDADETDEDDS